MRAWQPRGKGEGEGEAWSRFGERTGTAEKTEGDGPGWREPLP